jgi:hypothetical protein
MIQGYSTIYFESFLVLQGFLMRNNIIFKCDKNSLMFQNPFLIRISYLSWLLKKKRAGGI